MSNEFEIYNHKSLTTVLSHIYSNYINPDKTEMIETTVRITSIFEQIKNRMCEDPFFRTLYRKTEIGGSVKDGLKVFCPDEYDLNVVLKLPKHFTVFPSNIPGYVHLKEKDGVGDIRCVNYLPNHLKLTEDAYLLTKQLLSWTQKLLAIALNTFPKSYVATIINTKYGDFLITKISQIKPGFTLSVELVNDLEEITIDLVPCFEYDCKLLPKKYRKHITKGKCFLIPKVPSRDIPFKERYWRLCFQDYERIILHNRKYLKPSIKLLKVLKEELNIPTICSYHIKAICLYEMQKARKSNKFWKNRFDSCFLHLLNACILHIENGKIPAIYDRKCDLIEHVHVTTCKQIASKLKLVLKNIISNPDTRIIASYLLDKKELEHFERNF